MALTHWTTAHPATARAAQSITTRLVDPPAATPITPLWERTHPPKPGRDRGKGTGKDAGTVALFMMGIYKNEQSCSDIDVCVCSFVLSPGQQVSWVPPTPAQCQTWQLRMAPVAARAEVG